MTASAPNNATSPPSFWQRHPWTRRAVEIARELLHHKDPPHRIALGAALGMFVGMLPIMGIQMAVVTLLALPLRGNITAAVAGVWISNPLTFIPLYWFNYRFGLLFCPDRGLSAGEFKQKLVVASQWDWSSIRASLMRIIDMGVDLFYPLWLGSVISGVVLGVITYVVTYKWVVFYRARKRHP